jgi:hypothetical protein
VRDTCHDAGIPGAREVSDQNGRIVALRCFIGSRLVCEQPLNNRCVTHYSIQNAGAQAPGDYRFYGYQFADGDLRAGNEVRKVGIGFAYSVNGRVKTWSHGSEMSLWAAGALVLFIISYCWHRILR